MSAQTELQGLYEKWIQLTREEGVAIQAADWQKAGKIQSDKADLQKQINRAHDTFARLNSANKGISPFNSNIGCLISLENQNAEYLKLQHRRLQTERMEMERSHKNLHRIRNSYAASIPTADWQEVG